MRSKDERREGRKEWRVPFVPLQWEKLSLTRKSVEDRDAEQWQDEWGRDRWTSPKEKAGKMAGRRPAVYEAAEDGEVGLLRRCAGGVGWGLGDQN